MRTPARLYVGRLSNDIRRRDLEKFFRGYGRINEILLKEGFAFVEIDDDKDARDAVRDLNGRSVAGERVNVEFSRGPRSSRRDRYDDRDGRRDRYRDRDERRSYTSRYGPPRNTEFGVRVENLSSRVSWQDLKDFMRTADVEVTYADAHRKERGVGFVDFATAADMRMAIQKLDGQDLHGRKVRIEEKRRRSRSRSRSRSPRPRRSVSRSRSPRSRSRSRSKDKDSEVSRSPKSERSDKSDIRDRSRSRSRSPVNGVHDEDTKDSVSDKSYNGDADRNDNGDGSGSDN